MIGIFDSGAGGLCALRALMARIPNASFLYYADTAMLPFGEKPPHVIRARISRALAFFAKQRVTAVLFACGTASSYLTNECKERFTFPIFDIIAPTAARVKSKPARLCAVIATEASVTCGAFARAIAEEDTVLSLPCGALVPMAEAVSTPAESAVRAVLSPLFPADPDTLVLGCTHFSLLRAPIARLFPHARLIDAAACAADAVADSVRPIPDAHSATRFFTTGDPKRFRKTAERVLGEPLSPRLFQHC